MTMTDEEIKKVITGMGDKETLDVHSFQEAHDNNPFKIIGLTIRMRAIGMEVMTGECNNSDCVECDKEHREKCFESRDAALNLAKLIKSLGEVIEAWETPKNKIVKGAMESIGYLISHYTQLAMEDPKALIGAVSTMAKLVTDGVDPGIMAAVKSMHHSNMVVVDEGNKERRPGKNARKLH